MAYPVGDLLAAVSGPLPEELFDVLVESGDLTIERIVSRGHTSPASGWYDQARSEWVLVVQGAARIEFETEGMVELEAGHYLNISAHTRHRVAWTAPDKDTVWLAVHY